MISTADTIFASQCTSHLKIKLIKNVFFVCLPAFIVFFFTLKKGEQRSGSGSLRLGCGFWELESKFKGPR